MCMIDDSYGFDLWDVIKRRARKEHHCCECARMVHRGETYFVEKGFSKDIGVWEEVKICGHCKIAESWLQVVCFGHALGGVREDLYLHWDEDPHYRSWCLGS